MRNGKKTAIVFVLLLAMLFTLAACNPDEGNKPNPISEINLLKGWQGNEEEEIYTITNPGDALLKAEYVKAAGFEYAYMKYNLATLSKDQTALLPSIKTIVMTGKMTVTAGTCDTIAKLEYSDNTSTEVKFEMSAESRSYEWDVSALDLTKAVRLLLFVDAGGATGQGSVEFSAFKMVKNEVNAANQIGLPPVTPEINKNAYVSGDVFAANAGWYDNGDGVYTVTKTGSAFNVAYSKGTSTWATVKAIVTGDLSQMNKLVLKLQGTEGKTVLVKPYDLGALEKTVTFTGEEQTVEIEITAAAISGVDWTKDNNVFIFAEPGTADAEGSFKINDMTFKKETATQEDVTADIAAAGWLGDVGSVYTLSDSEGGLKIEYTKTAHEWANVNISPAGMSGYTYAVVTLTAEEGVSHMLKVETGGTAKEVNFTGTGAEQTVVLEVQGNGKIVLFAQAGTAAATGELTIKSIVLTNTAPSLD